MQIRYNRKRNRIIFNISIIIALFSTNLSAYPGCCYASKMYHNEWKRVGKEMKKYYTDAANITKKTEATLTDAVALMLYRSRDLISAMSYAYIFDASSETVKDLYKEYAALYMSSTGPILFDAILTGGDPIEVMSHPPRIEKSMMDFVIRTHVGAKKDGVLYGNQHLTKLEITYQRKEIQQECINDDMEIKKLEEDVYMLELALSKLAVLSNQVISKQKNK